MSSLSSKTTTFSLDSLNRLYFQFINKFVLPNLQKSVLEITKLLMMTNAFEVHKFLQNLVKQEDKKDNTSLQGSLNNLNNNLISTGNTINGASNMPYAYGIPVSNDNQKHYSQKILKLQTKDEKDITDSITFKPPLNLKRTVTSNYDDHRIQKSNDPKPKDDSYLYTNSHNKNLNNYNDLYKNINHPSKQELPSIPILKATKTQFENQEAATNDKNRLMKDIVKKISRIFNENQSKIQRYTKVSNSNSNHKYFSLSSSGKIDWKEQPRVREYQYHFKTEAGAKKY